MAQEIHICLTTVSRQPALGLLHIVARTKCSKVVGGITWITSKIDLRKVSEISFHLFLASPGTYTYTQMIG